MKDQESDAVKIAILLNLACPDAIELYNTFTLSDADAKKHTKVVKAFEQYCSPRKNIVFERFTFWQCTQAEDENVDQFVTRLKRIAKRCEFKDEEDMLYDEMVFELKDDSVKERLLTRGNLKLKEAIDIARVVEASKRQVKLMSAKPDKEVNFMKCQQRKVQEIQNCEYCGQTHPQRACPAFHKVCRYCNIVGHVENLCRRKQRDERNQYAEQKSQAEDGHQQKLAESTYPDLGVYCVELIPRDKPNDHSDKSRKPWASHWAMRNRWQQKNQTHHWYTGVPNASGTQQSQQSNNIRRRGDVIIPRLPSILKSRDHLTHI